MMGSSPEVSVVIPVFNKAPFIREAIESVLDPEYPDMEVLVVDDGSTDGSQEIVKGIGDARIRFIQNARNLGTAGIGNVMLKESRGTFMLRLDGDDLAINNRVRSQVRWMERHPWAAISSAGLERFGAMKGISVPRLNEKSVYASVLFECPVFQGASIMRREKIQAAGIMYDEQSPNVGEDWLFWFTAIRKGLRIINQPDILLKYRIHDSNVTGADVDNFRRDYLFTRIFEDMGFPLDQVEVHQYLRGIGRPLNRLKADALFDWLNFLLKWNEASKTFDQVAFSQQIEGALSKFFYPLADADASLGWYFMKKHGFTSGRLRYYLSKKLRK